MKQYILRTASSGLKTFSAAAVVIVALAGGTVLQLGTAAEAAAQTISCPLESIRRTVTTSLPSGWWHTPIQNKLTETKVVTVVGGTKALQCKYGPAGNIQRKFPANSTCRAIEGGFRCATRVAAGPRTHSTGEVNIPQTHSVDLDSGKLISAGADIWFRAETRDLLYFSPRNGARIGVGNRANRGFRGCSTARFTSERVSLRDIPVGSYVCVKTNKGRISQFRVNRISGGSPKTVTIGYTTWK